MKKYFIIFILFTLIGSGCKRQGTNTLDDFFPEVLALSSRIIPIDRDDIGNPVLLLCAGDFIICTNHNEEKFLTVYDSKTGERLNDLIYRGRGDIEILDVQSIWENGPDLYLHSGNSAKILNLPLADITSADPRISVRNIGNGFSRVQSINGGNNHIAFNATIAEGEDILPEDQFLLLDADYEPLFSFEKFPVEPKDVSRETSLVFQGKITAGSDGRSFIYGSTYGSILKFFTISASNEEITKINEYIIELPKWRSASDPSADRYSADWEKDCIQGVRSIVASNEGYLVLFDPSLTMADKEWMVSSMYEFDLAGNPVKKYELDRKIGMAAYDKNSNALIAFTEDEDGYFFVAYDL